MRNIYTILNKQDDNQRTNRRSVRCYEAIVDFLLQWHDKNTIDHVRVQAWLCNIRAEEQGMKKTLEGFLKVFNINPSDFIKPLIESPSEPVEASSLASLVAPETPLVATEASPTPSEINSEEQVPYQPNTVPQQVYIPQSITELTYEQEEDILLLSRDIATKRISEVKGEAMNSPAIVAGYLSRLLWDKPYEVFGIICCDSQNCVIACEELFRGTINSARVYPRDVVFEVLNHNAASVILYHNHPSTNPEPSNSDRSLTTRLTEALKLIDVEVRDHLVIGGNGYVSFAERGWI